MKRLQINPKNQSQRPKTVAQQIELYEYIYKHGHKANHGKHGMLGPYAVEKDRNKLFVNWLKSMLPPRSRILDASCGRGMLIKDLRGVKHETKKGWDVEGTEISSWLISNELTWFTCHCLTYDQLDQLPEKSYDAVCSMEVLEHLLDEDAVDDALTKLARLTRKFLLISCGLGYGPTKKYPVALGLDTGPLHTVVRSMKWWHERLSRHVRVLKHGKEKVPGRMASYVGFGILEGG